MSRPLLALNISVQGIILTGVVDVLRFSDSHFCRISFYIERKAHLKEKRGVSTGDAAP